MAALHLRPNAEPRTATIPPFFPEAYKFIAQSHPKEVFLANATTRRVNGILWRTSPRTDRRIDPTPKFQ